MPIKAQLKQNVDYDERKYYKSRALMDDLDLEFENPKLQEELKSLQLNWSYEKLSRDCFIES